MNSRRCNGKIKSPDHLANTSINISTNLGKKIRTASTSLNLVLRVFPLESRWAMETRLDWSSQFKACWVTEQNKRWWQGSGNNCTGTTPPLACEQAVWQWGGKRKESFHLQFPCDSPSTELSDFRNQHEAQISKNTSQSNDVITNVISANQHFASTFSVHIFKFQRRSCKLYFLFPPHRQSAPESLLAGYPASGNLHSRLPPLFSWPRFLVLFLMLKY